MRKLMNKPYVWFILPGFILYVVFMIAPLITSLSISFYKWNGYGPRTYVGLNNYIALFTDPRYSKMLYHALGNNFKAILVMLLIIMPLQILLAYLFHIKIKGYRPLQLMIFLPNVFSSMIVSFFVMLLFNPNFGLINAILTNLGLAHWIVPWLGDPKKSFTIYMLVAGWQGIGVGMMLFLANMKNISEDIIEAGIIDGANEIQKFFRIVLPSLIPSITNIIVLVTIWGLTIFDLPYAIGGSGGGVDGSIDFMNLFFFRYAFGNTHGGEAATGFAAAISTVLFCIILVISSIQSAFLNKIDIES